MPTLTPSPQFETGARTRIMEPDGARFRDDFNHNSFLFSHNLAGNPLFELPRLTVLAEALLKKQGPTTIRWKNSQAPVDSKWAQLPPNEQIASVSDAIQNLDQSGSWVVLYSIQNDPEYGALLEQALDELEEMTGRHLRDEITWKDANIFMGSPHAVTPYHVDHETTFLMQIHGDRLAYLWDQKDRSLLTEKEIEDYYMGELGAATYQAEKEKEAHVYQMDAGKGVHHPVLAPHYYKTGATYGVALGIHFCLRSADLRARAYQANSCLRRLGLHPVSPGISPWRDRIKIGAVSLAHKRNPKSKFDLIRSGGVRLKGILRRVTRSKE